MYKLLVALALVAGASAFAPVVKPTTRSSVAVSAAVEDMLGADVETAGVWDPFGYSTNADAATLKRYRCVEIKHGRIAQIATIGYIMGDVWTFPGYLSKAADVKFSDVPAGMGALQAVPVAGWAQIFLFAGLLETKFFKQDDDKEPGDLAKFNWVRYDDKELKERKLLSEIKNGRLAMMAIMGMMVQEQVTGMTTIAQLKSGALSPFPHIDL